MIANHTPSERDEVVFAVGKKPSAGLHFEQIDIDQQVSSVLSEMFGTTIDRLFDIADDPTDFELGEIYDQHAFLAVPLDDPLVASLRDLHENHFTITPGDPLQDLTDLNCYVGKITTAAGKQMTGIKRSRTFRSVDGKNPVSLAFGGGLTVVNGPVFVLDTTFDIIVDEEAVYIYEPKGLEYTFDLGKQLLSLVPGHIQSIQSALPFLDLTNIGVASSSKVRMARALASAAGSGKFVGLTRAQFNKQCGDLGILVIANGALLSIDDESIDEFIDMIDHRRYLYLDANGNKVFYRAAARKALTK